MAVRIPVLPSDTGTPATTTTTTRTTTPPPAPTTTTSGGGGGSSSGGGGGSSSGGGGGDDTPSWVKRQEAEQDAADKRAAEKYSDQAKRLQKQAEALRIALGKEGYKKALQTQLKNIKIQFEEQDSLILEGYARGRRELERQVETNEQAKNRGTVQALTNAGRERAEALQQVANQGAGLTDSIRAQAASLRNWSFNQNEVNENYIDTVNSLNSAESEMVNMVKAQRQSAWRQRQEQKATVYRGYYDDRSRTLTDVGNKLGEAANYWGQANETVPTSLRQKNEDRLEAESNKAFRDAAKQTGKAYEEKPTPGYMKRWQGEGQFKDTINQRQYARPQYKVQRAEGATLRRWDQ